MSPVADAHGKHGGQRGMALVIVLWIVALLSVQVVIFNASVRGAAVLAGNEMAMARGEALIAAAVEMAAARLLEADPSRRWIADGGMREVALGGARLRIAVYDENARIDINLADTTLLASLLRQTMARPSEAEALAARIVEWRDGRRERGDKPPGNAMGQTQQLRPPDARGPFLDAADLGRVPGMATLAMVLAPILTIYSRNGRINYKTASQEVLRALPGANPTDVDRALEQRVKGGPASLGVPQLLAGSANWIFQEAGPAYSIVIDVGGTEPPVIGKAEVIIMLDTDPSAPFRILGWRRQSGRNGFVVAARYRSAVRTSGARP